MQQFHVIKHITLILGRMVSESVSELLERPVEVAYGYSPELRTGADAISILHCGLERRTGSRDREYEWSPEGEKFRSPPLLMRSRYLVSAWAKAPDDQELLGAILRTFLDHPYLEPKGEVEEEAVGYAGIPSVDMLGLTLDDQRALCAALQIPLAPSMCYAVDFRLQSGTSTPIKRVKERVIDFRKIEG